jgi:hypothetical protein
MAKIPADVIKESYLLKSTFFYNKLRSNGYFDMFKKIQELNVSEGGGLDWSEREQWKVSEDAWKVLEESRISPMLVFVHPDILGAHPQLLRYYRSIAMVSQKGLKAVSGVSNVERIEAGNVKSGALASAIVTKLVCAINEVISLVVSLSTSISENELRGMLFATAGTNIDGSWRNSIGDEGERVIRSIIVKELFAQKEVTSIIDAQNKTRQISELDVTSVLDSIANIRTISVKNGYSIQFAAEPDVQMFDESGNIVGIVEIKAGNDPAGALERLGAMLKTFDNIRAEYPNAVTILVASCITNELQSRIGASMSIGLTYLTTEITSSESSQRKFANQIRKILNLTK